MIGIVARNIRNIRQDLWFAFFTFQTRDFISKLLILLFELLYDMVLNVNYIRGTASLSPYLL